MIEVRYDNWRSGGERVKLNCFAFPGGDPHVQVAYLNRGDPLTIDVRYGSIEDIGYLMLVNDILRREGCKDIALFIPYFPCARQDKVDMTGVPLSVKVFADLINSMKFWQVQILDPHSSVLPALLDNCSVIDYRWHLASAMNSPDLVGLICPDAGAERRVYALADTFNKKISSANNAMEPFRTRVDEGRPLEILRCSKHRDPATGKLSGFEAEKIKLPGRYLVVDDICDGGGTFIGLSEQLKKDPMYKDCKIDLYVTHGIFSKGIVGLLQHFDKIYTTDSHPGSLRYIETVASPDRVKVMKLFDGFEGKES